MKTSTFSFFTAYLLFLAGVIILLGSTALSPSDDEEEASKKETSDKYDFETPEFVVQSLYKGDKMLSEYNPRDEVKSKRTRSSKHFRQPDGTMTAISVAGNFHYMENGVWKTVVNYIHKNKTGKFISHPFAAVHNKQKLYFPDQSSEGVITEVDNGQYTDWKNVTMEWLSAGYKPINKVKANLNDVNIVNDPIILYKNIFNKIDAEIVNSTTDKKLSYTIQDSTFVNQIPNAAKYVSFSETIELEKSWRIKADNENLSFESPTPVDELFVFNDKGDTVLQIEQPVYYDHTDSVYYPEHINADTNSYFEGNYHIKKVQANQYRLKTIVPASWLKHRSRKYPVVIDPTNDYYPNGSNGSGTVDEGGGCRNGTGLNRMYNTDITYGWTDDYFWNGNVYMSGYATFDISGIPDNSCIFSTSYDWRIYHRNGCDNDLRLRFGRAEYNSNLQSWWNSCGIIEDRINDQSNYYDGTGKDGTGWHGSNGNNTHLDNALSGNDINAVWQFKSDWNGDDCCSFWCNGDDSDWRNIYGEESCCNKPYVRVDYEEGAPSTFDKVWTGRVNSDWENNNNWCPNGDPGNYTSVYIPNTGNDPVIDQSQSVGCIVIHSSGNADLEIQESSGGELNVTNNDNCPVYP